MKNKDFTNNDSNLERFRSLQNNLTNTTETTKQQYFARIAKKQLTGKKVPCISPIFHENRFITDFRENVELFNSFFANQYSLIANSSPVGIYLLKVNNRNTRTRCEICSKLAIKTPERRYWRCSGVSIVNFEHISHLVPAFLLLTLNW